MSCYRWCFRGLTTGRVVKGIPIIMEYDSTGSTVVGTLGYDTNQSLTNDSIDSSVPNIPIGTRLHVTYSECASRFSKPQSSRFGFNGSTMASFPFPPRQRTDPLAGPRGLPTSELEGQPWADPLPVGMIAVLNPL